MKETILRVVLTLLFILCVGMIATHAQGYDRDNLSKMYNHDCDCTGTLWIGDIETSHAIYITHDTGEQVILQDDTILVVGEPTKVTLDIGIYNNRRVRVDAHGTKFVLLIDNGVVSKELIK